MQHGRWHISKIAVVTALAFAAGLAGTSAGAQESVCLSKTDRTGGSLGFVVLARDAAMFERAGFARVTCPDNIATRAPDFVRRCARFEGQSHIGRAAIAELYELTVAEMCRATRDWAGAADAGEER